MVIANRISENFRYDTNIDRMANARAEADNVNEMAASGRKLRKISDDPAGTVKVLRNRAGLTNIEQFKKSVEFGKGFLSKSEDTLSSIFESLLRAKELAIQQANSTYSQEDRIAVASELKQIMQHVVKLGNSKYNDKFIFGGFQTTQPPIAPDGHYLGDDGQIFIQVDEDSFRPINVNGRSLFDGSTDEHSPHPPLIDILKNLHNSLVTYDPAELHTAMSHLDLAMGQVLTIQSSFGARHNALEDVSDRIERNISQLSKENNTIESADMVKTALDLKRAENALQFTLQASSKMISPSLIDFIK